MDDVILSRLGLVVITWAQIEAQCGELFECMLKASPGTLHVLIPTVSNATRKRSPSPTLNPA